MFTKPEGRGAGPCAPGRSARGDEDPVVAAGAIGSGAVCCSVWMSPVRSVARTSMLCRPGVAVHETSHCTQVASEIGRLIAALLPRAVVEADLDPGDAAIRRPGDAARRRPARRRDPGRPRRVDPRLGQDRRVLGPAERNPVAVDGLTRRQLDRAQPLRRRNVAVQARDDQPRRGSRGRRAGRRGSSRPRPSARARERWPTRSGSPP